MLIHIVPRILIRNNFQQQCCELVDISSEELGFSLKGGLDVVARRPYPNKQYLVACRKKGQKAFNGLFVQSKLFKENFSVTTRWALVGEQILTQVTHYEVLDMEHDAVTECVLSWERYPATLASYSPVAIQPMMDLEQNTLKSDVTDSVVEGVIVRREIKLPIYTQSVESVLNALHFRDRCPAISDAFLID
ncbi:DUF6012 family protein [Aeromonas salmonicida]|uniref:DUF6012 family protein n=1 Tax=Aeromonas salmonicida TaxID=645 RepID=UPI003D027117